MLAGLVMVTCGGVLLAEMASVVWLVMPLVLRTVSVTVYLVGADVGAVNVWAGLTAVLVVNRAALSAHEALVAQVAREMTRAGRIAWRNLSLRARLAGANEGAHARRDVPQTGRQHHQVEAGRGLHPAVLEAPAAGAHQPEPQQAGDQRTGHGEDRRQTGAEGDRRGRPPRLERRAGNCR